MKTLVFSSALLVYTFFSGDSLLMAQKGFDGSIADSNIHPSWRNAPVLTQELSVVILPSRQPSSRWSSTVIGIDRFPIASLSVRQSKIERHLHSVQAHLPADTITVERLIRVFGQMDLPCYLDQTAVDDMLDLDEPLNLLWTNEPLYQRLKYVLGTRNACLTIQQDMLRIISKDVANDPEYFTTITYDIDALQMDSHNLANLIRSTVAPDDWDDTNGDATLMASELKGRAILTISAPYDTHLQVRKLLNDLWSLSVNGAGSSTIAPTFKGSSTPVELPARQPPGRQYRHPTTPVGGIF